VPPPPFITLTRGAASQISGGAGPILRNAGGDPDDEGPGGRCSWDEHRARGPPFAGPPCVLCALVTGGGRRVLMSRIGTPIVNRMCSGGGGPRSALVGPPLCASAEPVPVSVLPWCAQVIAANHAGVKVVGMSLVVRALARRWALRRAQLQCERVHAGGEGTAVGSGCVLTGSCLCGTSSCDERMRWVIRPTTPLG
jgi:hypothetical protein